MREILGDHTLELFWWDRDGALYIDVHDGPGELATVDASVPRVATLVEYETRKVGAILHDPRLLDRHDFLEAFVPAMRIAMERDRLHRDLLEKIDELKASRLRIVEAADEEQRRLERNLHDGAQPRLVVVLLGLLRLRRGGHERDQARAVLQGVAQPRARAGETDSGGERRRRRRSGAGRGHRVRSLRAEGPRRGARRQPHDREPRRPGYEAHRRLPV